MPRFLLFIMVRNSRLLSAAFGIYLLSGATSCVTYHEDIKIYDTQGNVYRKPRQESSFDIRRNRPEQIAEVPRGRKGFLLIEYTDSEGVRRKGRVFLDPRKRYVVFRRTNGDLAVFEGDREE